MMRRVLPLAFTFLVTCTLLPRPAFAATISLASAIEGTAVGGEVIDLTVSFDPNASSATNLVGMELYVGFTGLTPVSGGYALGDVFAAVLPADVLALDGLCSDFGGCSYPTSDPASPPALPVARRRLHAVGGDGPWLPLHPAVQGADRANWSLNLFGDDQAALLWDPPPTCDPSDLTCAEIPEPIPFAIVHPGTPVASGTARVDVGATVAPAAVPEPAALLLMGSGLAGAALRKRALRRRQS